MGGGGGGTPGLLLRSSGVRGRLENNNNNNTGLRSERGRHTDGPDGSRDGVKTHRPRQACKIDRILIVNKADELWRTLNRIRQWK